MRQVALLQRLSGLPADALARAAARPRRRVGCSWRPPTPSWPSNQVEAAFERLIGLVRRLRGDDRDPVRDRLVEYFELLGPDDPRVGPARRDLANALF